MKKNGNGKPGLDDTQELEPEKKSPRDEEEEELPIVEAVGWARTRRGWTVVFMRSQGKQILETEIEAGPDSRAVAQERVKVAVVRRLLARPS